MPMTWLVAGASPHRLVGVLDAQQYAVSARVTNTSTETLQRAAFDFNMPLCSFTADTNPAAEQLERE